MAEFTHNAPLAFIAIVVKRVVGLTLQFELRSKSSSKQILTRVVAKNSTPTIFHKNNFQLQYIELYSSSFSCKDSIVIISDCTLKLWICWCLQKWSVSVKLPYRVITNTSWILEWMIVLHIRTERQRTKWSSTKEGYWRHVEA